jgi:hypothetical protein
MAESDNILTKLQDLQVYDNAIETYVVRLVFVAARCSYSSSDGIFISARFA